MHVLECLEYADMSPSTIFYHFTIQRSDLQYNSVRQLSHLLQSTSVKHTSSIIVSGKKLFPTLKSSYVAEIVHVDAESEDTSSGKSWLTFRLTIDGL